MEQTVPLRRAENSAGEVMEDLRQELGALVQKIDSVVERL